MPEPDSLTTIATLTPDAVAVHDPDGPSLTFAELEAQANRLARVLLARGVRPGDRVAWCGPNSTEVLLALHATRKVGATTVPVSYRFTPDELDYVVADCGAEVVLADVAYAGGFADALAWGTPEWDDLLAAQRPEPPEPVAPGTQMIYTSGTTGKPKGAVRGPRAPQITEALMTTLRLRAGEEVHLTTGPLYHSGPLSWALMAHATGSAVVLMRSFDPARWLEHVRRYRVTNTFTAPTPLKRIVALPPEVLATADLSSMRSLVANAAPVPYALKQEIHEKLGDWFLFEVYGSTELGVDAVLPPEEQLARPGSCGRALPGVELKVVDEDGAELPAGEPGVLMVRSAASFVGYHGRPPVDDGDGWKSVGDLASIDADGYVHIRDRGGDLVITGGMNVYPAEVEAVLHGHPDVLDVAVFGVPSDEWGQSVHAVVVAREGHGIDLAALDGYVAARLAGYKRPRSWEVRDVLPRTESGKALKRLLREEYDAQRPA